MFEFMFSCMQLASNCNLLALFFVILQDDGTTMGNTSESKCCIFYTTPT